MLKNFIFLYSLFFQTILNYTYKEVSQYENITLSLTINNPYNIFQFNNQPYQLKDGFISIFFEKRSYNYIKVYIQDDYSKIQESIKGEFINYKGYSSVNSYSNYLFLKNMKMDIIILLFQLQIIIIKILL